MLVVHCGVGKRKRKKSLEIIFDTHALRHSWYQMLRTSSDGISVITLENV